MSAMTGNLFAIPPAGQTPIRATRHSLRFAVQDILVFLIPLTGFLELHLVGRLFAPDMIMLALFPFLVSSMGRHLAAPLPRMFIVLGLIWLLGQVATDIIRSTPFHDFVRGWAKIVFTLINFCVIYLLIKNRPRRVFLYAAGLVCSGILGYYLNPDIYAADYPWKFGVGGPITLLVILVATWVSGNKSCYRNVPILVAGVIGLFNIYMGFRSLGGLCLLTSIYLVLQSRMRRRINRSKPIRLRNIVMLGVALSVGSFMAIGVYEYTASSGFLGEAAKAKYEAQSGEYGILLGGRTEMLVSGRAIMESPVIGHGSWAKNWDYAELLDELRRRLGYASLGVGELGLIPTHSHLMGAWVEAGILGAIFWLWVLSLSIRTLIRLYQTRTYLSPLIAFFTFALIWGVLFSPYGAERRFITPYYVIVIMIFLSLYMPEKKIKTR